MIGIGAHVIFFFFLRKKFSIDPLGEMNSTCPLLKVHFDYEAVCMTDLFF